MADKTDTGGAYDTLTRAFIPIHHGRSFTAQLADEAYQAVRQQVSDAEAQLLAAPPEDQRHLFIQYIDTENNAFSLQLRDVFQEALLIAHDILRLLL